MEGISWSAARAHESFSRPQTAADTLSKLAKLIAQAEPQLHPQNHNQYSSPTYVCAECGKSFSFGVDLLHHQEVKHPLPKPHQCRSCGKEFSLKSSLQLHKCNQSSSLSQLCHGESRLASLCPSCVTRTTDGDSVQDKSPHRQPTLLDRSPYACAPCGKGFSQKQALLHHQQAGCGKHKASLVVGDISGLQVDSPPVSDGDSARSDFSDTPGPSGVSEHVCPYCSKSFRYGFGLLRHKQMSHPVEQIFDHKAQGTKPERVGAKRREKANAKVHKSKHKLLSCRSCDMVFRSTANLYVHRKEKHTRERNNHREPRPAINKRKNRGTYPCQVCGKVFFHHLSLSSHSRQHATFPALKTKSILLKDVKRPKTETIAAPDGKPIKRPRGRPRKSPLVVGETVHSGRRKKVPATKERIDRDFPCPSCPEVFSLYSQLREHTELHQSSLRRRRCSVCTEEMDGCKWRASKRQRLYHCVPCQQGYSELDAFLEHCQGHLRAKVEEDVIADGATQLNCKI